MLALSFSFDFNPPENGVISTKAWNFQVLIILLNSDLICFGRRINFKGCLLRINLLPFELLYWNRRTLTAGTDITFK